MFVRVPVRSKKINSISLIGEKSICTFQSKSEKPVHFFFNSLFKEFTNYYSDGDVLSDTDDEESLGYHTDGNLSENNFRNKKRISTKNCKKILTTKSMVKIATQKLFFMISEYKLCSKIDIMNPNTIFF